MGFLHDTLLLSRPMSATGTAASADLRHCRDYALHAVVSASPSAKTFDSAASATLEEQDLTWTAAAPGAAGNSITIATVDGATAGDEVVTVDGNDIVIEIEDGVSTAQQIFDAYEASAAAMALATIAITGTAATAQDAAAEAPLAGGVTSEINLTAETMTIPSHGFHTGLKVQATTTGSLPTGLATTTDYWVIKVDTDTIKLASSLANADAGTAINLTAEGSGVHTLTSTAGTLAHSLQLQKSCDSENWVNEGSAQAISATGSFMFEGTGKGYRFLRLVNTVTTGQAMYRLVLNAK